MSQSSIKPSMPSNRMRVSANAEGQRLDNYLRKQTGLPLAAVYRLVRKGQVRVNGGRKKPDYRLQLADEVRVPPSAVSVAGQALDIPAKVKQRLAQSVLVETEAFMVINKHAGMAVHGGSGLAWGVIDVVKQLFPQLPDLELAHRLDRDTSGCLFLAKNRHVAKQFQQMQKQNQVIKTYRCLVFGHWPKAATVRDALDIDNRVDGERHVVVKAGGREAISHFKTLAMLTTGNGFQFSDMQVKLETGRTHQIRVHSSSRNHPILGDNRYGDAQANQLAQGLGLKRLQLHAWRLEFEWVYPDGRREQQQIESPLDEHYQQVITEI